MVFLAELRKCAETHTIWGTEYGSLDLGIGCDQSAGGLLGNDARTLGE